MKRILAGLLAAFLVSTFVNLASAAGPRLRMTHKLADISKGETTVTLNYSVHVSNPGNTPLTDLTLTLAQQPPMAAGKVMLNVGTLGPHQDLDVPLQLVTPLRLQADRRPMFPLLWIGSYLDAQGKAIQFPAMSKPGGDK